jgi:hypothetical protein
MMGWKGGGYQSTKVERGEDTMVAKASALDAWRSSLSDPGIMIETGARFLIAD